MFLHKENIGWLSFKCTAAPEPPRSHLIILMYVPFFSSKPSSTHVKHYGSDEALISGHVHYSTLRLSKHLNEIICTNGLVVKLAVAIGQPPVRFRVSANSYLFAHFCLFSKVWGRTNTDREPLLLRVFGMAMIGERRSKNLGLHMADALLFITVPAALRNATLG